VNVPTGSTVQAADKAQKAVDLILGTTFEGEG
jgi:hypothetical protein